MHCSKCGHTSTEVVSSKTTKEGAQRRRRRECKQCGFRFTTYEHVPWDSTQVQKRDGSLEQYRTEKLRDGIQTAITDTNVSDETVNEIINAIERGIQNKDGKIVSSEFIGHEVADQLLDVNGVAFMRFVSVFEGFSRPEQFEKALRKINGEGYPSGEKNKSSRKNDSSEKRTEYQNGQSETHSSSEDDQ